MHVSFCLSYLIFCYLQPKVDRCCKNSVCVGGAYSWLWRNISSFQFLATLLKYAKLTNIDFFFKVWNFFSLLVASSEDHMLLIFSTFPYRSGWKLQIKGQSKAGLHVLVLLGSHFLQKVTSCSLLSNLRVYIRLTFHINGISTYYLLHLASLARHNILRCIHIVACISTLLLFMAD